MHVACMVVATLPLCLSMLLVEDAAYGKVLVGLTIASKTASNVGWFIMWVQAIEIFPTPLRNTGHFMDIKQIDFNLQFFSELQAECQLLI